MILGEPYVGHGEFVNIVGVRSFLFFVISVPGVEFGAARVGNHIKQKLGHPSLYLGMCQPTNSG